MPVEPVRQQAGRHSGRGEQGTDRESGTGCLVQQFDEVRSRGAHARPRERGRAARVEPAPGVDDPEDPAGAGEPVVGRGEDIHLAEEDPPGRIIELDVLTGQERGVLAALQPEFAPVDRGSGVESSIGGIGSSGSGRRGIGVRHGAAHRRE
ncbi:hypothetical protein KIV56_11865 [Cryobacterium breve]|uniref:DUF4926 domain-containing protein n=1 Tax=Cryobacterium breve TaxID=1259258 RepID=A0ABY7NIL8_9MICO|nr:hypothetical protein [Cryobacterium breve]WBM81637.1 hypothetical protein KIV56_11865 [Cryobacterium breve]